MMPKQFMCARSDSSWRSLSCSSCARLRSVTSTCVATISQVSPSAENRGWPVDWICLTVPSGRTILNSIACSLFWCSAFPVSSHTLSRSSGWIRCNTVSWFGMPWSGSSCPDSIAFLRPVESPCRVESRGAGVAQPLCFSQISFAASECLFCRLALGDVAAPTPRVAGKTFPTCPIRAAQETDMYRLAAVGRTSELEVSAWQAGVKALAVLAPPRRGPRSCCSSPGLLPISGCRRAQRSPGAYSTRVKRSRDRLPVQLECAKCTRVRKRSSLARISSSARLRSVMSRARESCQQMCPLPERPDAHLDGKHGSILSAMTTIVGHRFPTPESFPMRA